MDSSVPVVVALKVIKEELIIIFGAGIVTIMKVLQPTPFFMD
jgi:hypothetical protein